MAKIQINEFKGILPKIANDKLPGNMAQVAADVKTATGELRAFRSSLGDVELSTDTYKSLFEYLEGGNNHWVYYDDIVHWARPPVADDTFERLYFTGVDGEYRAFANDLFGTFDFLTDYYKPGAPVGKAPTVVIGTPGAVVTSFLYTLVSRYGEEGPPSAITSVTNDSAGSRNEINDITYPSTYDHLVTPTEVAPFPNRPYVSVYKIADSSSAFQHALDAEWFDATHVYIAGDFVFRDTAGGDVEYDLFECTVGGTGAAATFVKGAIVLDANLGSVLASTYYDHAPADLTNLQSHPNGFFVASKDNVLHFTEPFTPWAWPEDYIIPLDSQIIGLGIFGSTIVVATDGHIYTFSGPHPTALYKQKLSFQPCLSQRAVVTYDDGVIFPSLEGFQQVSANGVHNVTRDMFRPEDWLDYKLTTMHGHWYNKAYYGFFKEDGIEGHVIIDFLNGSVTTGVKYHHAGHVALLDGVFRTIVNSDISNPLNQWIAVWDADPSSYRNYSYKTPLYVLEKPGNFKVAQVILDTNFYNDVLDIISDGDVLVDLNNAAWTASTFGEDDLFGPLNGHAVGSEDLNGDNLYDLQALGVQSYVDFMIYADGVLKFTKQLTTSTMFKLPRGFKDKKWEIQLDGMIPVKRVTMATSTEEIV